MIDLDSVDYFSDPSLVDDPYPYFARLRASGPVRRLPRHGVVAVTGHQEALEVYRDPARFSSCNTVTGPFPPLPFKPEGDDISEQIEKHRHEFPMSEYLVTQDPPVHEDQRALLMRLFTPRRMRENETFMWRLAEAQIDEFLHSGRCEVLRDYARPFTLLVIADLLGVPEEDHRAFRQLLGGQLPDASTSKGAPVSLDPLAFLQATFTSYVEERRREPRSDVLTQLAAVTYSDGSVPEVNAVVRTATFLFAAGQDTTARLIASALRLIADRPDVQRYLRDDRERIPNFVEEVLRFDSVVKSDFRLARTSTSLAGVEIPAGTTVMILPGAANRDPRRFEQPDEFRPDRENAREHLSFGRGIHSCPGGSLSRLEAIVSIQRLLERTRHIRIAEDVHGPAGARRFTYDPTYVLRGLQALHLELDAGA